KPASLFAARFFSDLTTIPGQCLGGRVATPLGSFEAPDLKEGDEAIIALRPGSLAPSQDTDGVAARLTARRYLGDSVELVLAVEGVTEPIKACVAQCTAAVGDTLYLKVVPETVLVFPSATN